MSSSNTLYLYINHNVEKTKFDRIAISKQADEQYTVHYKGDCTTETVGDVKVMVRVMENHHDLLDYVEDMMDLLLHDIDTSTVFTSIDVIIPCVPVVAVNPKCDAIKQILLRNIRSWTKSSSKN